MNMIVNSSDLVGYEAETKKETKKAVSKAQALRNLLKVLFRGKQRSVLLAGSTHPGEELMIARKFKKLKHEFPDLCYVVAPRHVERCKILFEELSKEGLKTQLRSQLDYEQSNQSGYGHPHDCIGIC